MTKGNYWNYWYSFFDLMPEKSGCIRWKGQYNKRGYGTVCVKENSKWKTKTAHSYIFQKVKNVIIPKGKVACHSCDNRWCVNPSHIFVGTYQENVDDMYKKGRELVNVNGITKT